ncbi:HprK-related kinase A [Iodidimonas sp. SYSU 1G8]|uniref:HprK-related kinase A n=1 Tax=Iodidimonas sp. SYSU 1G8 TaxID=3133967 RepID=UPI0031FEBB95
MSRIGGMALAAFSRRVAAGACLDVPPFIVGVHSPLSVLHRSLHGLYGHFDILSDAVPDFSIRVAGTGGLRRFIRRQSMAFIDTPPPYVPLPEHMAALMFEQAFNWCVATRTFTHLILHAAVVAREGRAIIIPGQSGQGKSTLCAALVARGWRHVSDEFCLLDPETLRITAHPRPISLKNASIDVVAAWAPDLVLSTPLRETPKGTVAYVQPRRADIDAAGDLVAPVAVVFPHFDPEAEAGLSPMGKAAAFIALSACSVNYREIGKAGFEALSAIAGERPVLAASYSDTAGGVGLIEGLLDGL